MHWTIRSRANRAGTPRAAKSGMRGCRWLAFALAFLAMLPGGAAFAQYDTGSVVGGEKPRASTRPSRYTEMPRQLRQRSA